MTNSEKKDMPVFIHYVNIKGLSLTKGNEKLKNYYENIKYLNDISHNIIIPLVESDTCTESSVQCIYKGYSAECKK